MTASATSPEPFLVRQTFETEHVATREAARRWQEEMTEEARAQGGTFARFSWHDEDGVTVGLLFECWTEQPADQGEQRWSFEGRDA
jgi:hypothetical protein